MNLANDFAGRHIATVTTGRHSTFYRALADRAHAVAIDGFCPIHAAAFAVDMFWQYGGVVQLGPNLGGFLAKYLIIVFSGTVGIALLAVQSAVGNQDVLLFHIGSSFLLVITYIVLANGC